MRSRSASLSDGEVKCLMLVAEHLSSKEIAVRLGISSHTVDQRVRRSLHLLGLPTRRHAARWVKQACWPQPANRVQGPNGQNREIGWGPFGQSPVRWLVKVQLPVATPAHLRNTMSIGRRLLWIGLIAVSAFGSGMMYLAGLGSLAKLLR